MRDFSRREDETQLSGQFVANNQVVLSDFNLSRNKSLQTLETTAESINAAYSTASNFLGTILSTVTSPTPLDVVVVYRDVDLGGIRGGSLRCSSNPVCPRHSLQEERVGDEMLYKQQFRVFREMHNARDFRLVLCADVPDCVVEQAIQTLEHIVNAGEINGELDYLFCKPLVIFERRTSRM